MAGPKRLSDTHPDKGCEIGDNRTVNNIRYRLYENQFGVTWNGGAKGGVVRCSNNDIYCAPFDNDPGITPFAAKPYKDFDKAAEAAQKAQHRQYIRAKGVVDAYEAP